MERNAWIYSLDRRECIHTWLAYWMDASGREGSDEILYPSQEQLWITIQQARNCFLRRVWQSKKTSFLARWREGLNTKTIFWKNQIIAFWVWIRNQCCYSLSFQKNLSFCSKSMPGWQPTQMQEHFPSPHVCYTVGVRTSLFLWEYRVPTFHLTTVSAPENNTGSFWQQDFSPGRRLGEVERTYGVCTQRALRSILPFL